jgi:diguanylate cyclase (GGDEF)-like protein
MHALRANQLLIFAILLTLVLLGAHPMLPQKKLSFLGNSDFKIWLETTQDKRGKDLGFWIDEKRHIWACEIPEDLDRNIYQTCAFNIDLTADLTKGVDLSGFSNLSIELKHDGGNESFRVSIRNFNPKYSTLADSDTSKYHAVTVYKSDLYPLLNISLEEFRPADWWLLHFKIPREDAGRDLSNAITFAIDIERLPPAGFYQMQLNQIRFSGDYVSRENWYLLVISPWLIGILIYAINQMRLLRLQVQVDRQEIYQLAQQNSSLKKLSDEFRRLSTIDPLTQCFNRFGVHQIVSHLLEQPAGKQPLFSLIIVDIDYFKRINDNRGHDWGDKVLQTIGSIIHDRIREQDFAGRWGGEEFIIVLPNTNQEFALAIAEKLRILIFDQVFDPDRPLNVTASFGVGQHEISEDFATTFKRVDTALYSAKQMGRNCCVVAENPTQIK